MEKSRIEKDQPGRYAKLKRIDPKILKKATSRIDPEVAGADPGIARRLVELGPGPKVLSIYVNLDPTEFPVPRQRESEVVSLIDQAAAKLEKEPEHDRKELRKDVQKLRAWLLEHSDWDDGAQGLAIFCSNERDFFEVLKVAVPVKSLVAIESTPYVEPLTQVAPSRAVCVALVERDRARIFCGTDEHLEEVVDEQDDDVPGRHDQGGWSQHRYQAHIEDHVDRHLEGVASRLFELSQEGKVERLIVGSTQELLPRILRHLHSYLREAFAGRIQVDLKTANADEVLEKARMVLEAEDLRRDRELQERLLSELAVGGKAVAGLEDTLAAVNEARVEILFVREGFAAPGVFCPSCGWVGVSAPGGPGQLAYSGGHNPLAEADGPECPVDGGVLEPTADVVDKAVERTLLIAGTVWVPRDAGEIDRLGGIAALLRF